MTDISKLDEAGLEDLLSEPSEATKRALARLDGDIAVLGAGGKMGPTLAIMLRKAAGDKEIYAVSRFSDDAGRNRMEAAGVKTIAADLLDESAYSRLPKAPNVFYLAGMKFGSAGNQSLTWAMNSFMPALVARHYRDARIVAFSTGNVYPLVDADGRGANEQTIPEPIGEYAQSCLGRERMFEYFSQVNGTPATLIRLNYANEPRYGIIVDLTLKILHDEPVDLTMGAVNLIWQRDANDYIIRSMTLAESPPMVLNVTGPDVVPVRRLTEMIAKEAGKEPQFVSRPSSTALLSDASRCIGLFGRPRMPLEQMVSMIVRWVASGGKILNKPTKYDIRNGRF